MLRVAIVTCVAVSLPAQAGWQRELDGIQKRIERLKEQLDLVQGILKQRTKDDAALLARVVPPLPAPTQHGYGLVPRVLPDVAEKTVPLHRTLFSIPLLEHKGRPVWRAATALVGSAMRGALEAQVREFERLRGQYDYLKSLASYHRYWQNAVVEHDRFFAQRNKVLRLADRLKTLVDGRGDPRDIDKLRVLIEAKVAPFRKTPGLRVVERDGEHVLPVTVVTDIEDERFLEAYRNAVHTIFNGGRAATQVRFRIALTFQRVAARDLYRKAVPKRGDTIDEAEHLARFPEGALVLTTGAKSTHAFVGRYIQLGTGPMRGRELAHEFGHLLGFSDAYLRGFEGTPNGPRGCVIVEWGGLQDNLMGAPKRGPVTVGMIRRLLRAYGD